MNTQPSHSGIFPRFYMEPVQNKKLTEQMGCPQFVDVEMVEITIAGDSKTLVVHKVRDEHRNRWPQHYEAFKKGQQAPTTGLPLKHCPLFTSAQVATMNANNIFTVEALAELNDAFIPKLGMGARGLVAKAKAYLNEAQGSAEVTKLAAENERLSREIEMLKEKMRSLSESPQQFEGTVVEFKPENTNTGNVEPKPLPADFDAAGFSSRTKTALKKAGIETIEELLEFTMDDLANIQGIGIGAIEEISRLVE